MTKYKFVVGAKFEVEADNKEDAFKKAEAYNDFQLELISLDF